VGRKTEEGKRRRLTPIDDEHQVDLETLPLYEMPSDDEVRCWHSAIMAATKNMGIGQAFWNLLFGRATQEEEEDPAKKNRELVDELGDKITFMNVELSRLGGKGGSSSPLTTDTTNNDDNLFKISIDLNHLLMEGGRREGEKKEEEVEVLLSSIKDFHIIPERAFVSISWTSLEEGEGRVRTVRLVSPEALDIYTALIYYLNAQMVEKAKESSRKSEMSGWRRERRGSSFY